MKRSTLEIAPNPPATSEVRWWLARYLTLTSPQILAMRGAMPMACNASALRRPASARLLRALAWVTAVREGPRVMNSDISVMLVKIAQRREAVTLTFGAQRQQHHDVIDAPAQAFVQRRGNANHDARANNVE